MVGLILSTFNGEQYIVQQLDSLRNQTVEINHVLIKDDCSQDKTVDIIQNYITQNKLDWVLISNDKNIGWIKNFLSGILMLDDDYVFFCDQDDIWIENKVEKSIKAMKKFNAEVVCCNYQLLYSSNSASKVLEKEKKKQINNKLVVKVKKTESNFYIRRPGCSMCISREVIEKAKKYLELQYPHDAIFWKIALLDDRLFNINERLLIWRRHSSNASTLKKHSSQRRKDSLKKEMIFASKLLQSYPNDKLCLKYNKFIESRVKLYEEPSLFNWIRICPYIRLYVSFKSYLGDLYLCLKQKMDEIN